MKSKNVWRTTMWEEAEKQGLGIMEFARRGKNIYHFSYLSLLKNGQRPVPNSITFQEWAAGVLGLKREDIFFAEPLAFENNSLAKEEKAAS